MTQWRQTFRVLKTLVKSPWHSMGNVTEEALALLFNQLDAKSDNKYVQFKPNKKDM